MVPKRKIKTRRKNNKNDKHNNESLNTLCNITGMTTSIPTTATSVMNTNTITERNNNNNPDNNDINSFFFGGGGDLDDCLAQMDNTTRTIETATTTTTTETSNMLNNNVNRSIMNDNHCNSNHQQQQQKKRNFVLPNVRIELARHLHMRELSEYLLGSILVESSTITTSNNNDEDDKGSSRKKKKSKMVPLLRMPTFERWCIDSKMEECTKQQQQHLLQQQQLLQNNNDELDDNEKMTTKKNNRKVRQRKRKRQRGEELSISSSLLLNSHKAMYTDPVIPSMVEISDDSSLRLIEEILCRNRNNGNNGGETKTAIMEKQKMEAKAIVFELCRRSISASKKIKEMMDRLDTHPLSINVGDDNGEVMEMKRKLIKGGEIFVLEMVNAEEDEEARSECRMEGEV